METIHIISHTHWDREWYQTFQQFRLRLVHLLDNILALLEQDPCFKHFMMDGQTICLEDYLQMRPEKHIEICNLVQTGRLLIGPWYILPDEFLVSPESIIRNLMEGRRVCNRFGAIMKIGYIPDPFGHIGQMPQILQGFGINSACVWRGLSDEPCEFWWQSPNGTPIFMAYIRDSYGNAASLPANDPDRFCEETLRMAASLSPHSACGQRLLMFGTDHTEPPVETSSAIAFASNNYKDTRLIHSTLPAYIEDCMHELASTGSYIPTIQGELRSSKRSPLLPGVLSTRMWIKQRNHTSETMLERWAEPFSTWASMVVCDPIVPVYNPANRLQNPSRLLQEAWRILLTCQPHDSICGCSIDQVHEEMRTRFDQVEQIAKELTLQSLAAIAGKVDTLACEDCFAAITVFNPLPGTRSEPVELEVKLPPGIDAFEVVEKQPGGDYAALPFETTGLGSGELINMILSPEEFYHGTSMVQGGRITGMAIKSLEYERQEDTIVVRIILSERGEPNLDALASGMKEIGGLREDRTIQKFKVIARSEDAVRLRFLASEVDGPGLKTFWLRKALPAPVRQVKMNLLTRIALTLAKTLLDKPIVERWLNNPKPARPPFIIENEYYRVEADRMNGCLDILDKRTGVRYTGLNRFVDGGECGDTYNYCPPSIDELFMEGRVQHVYISSGLTTQQLDIYQQLHIPECLSQDRKARSKKLVDLQIQSTVTLWTGSQRIDIRTKINNHAHDHRLRVHFPMPFTTSHAASDAHFDIVERSTELPEWDQSWVEQPRPEKPQRMFTNITNGKSGFVLAVRGLPEVEVLKNTNGKSELALTLLRCVGWLSRDDLLTRPGHAGPFIATPGAQMPGEYSFDYSLISYSSATNINTQSAAYRQARYFNAPMQTEYTGIHPGSLSHQCKMVSIEPDMFELSTIKQAEDGSGWILRGYNPLKDPVQVTLQPWRRFPVIELARIDETRIGTIDSNIDGTAKIIVDPHSIVTIRFRD